MGKDLHFGFLRSEHDYWLDQAIYRVKCLKQKRTKVKDRLQLHVQVK